jgi:hypothetical protein
MWRATGLRAIVRTEEIVAGAVDVPAAVDAIEDAAGAVDGLVVADGIAGAAGLAGGDTRIFCHEFSRMYTDRR